MRTGHAKELRQYRYLIDKEDDPMCECGMEETIEHILCNCEITVARRAVHFEGPVTVDMPVTDTQRCRKFLEPRNAKLKLIDDNTTYQHQH